MTSPETLDESSPLLNRPPHQHHDDTRHDEVEEHGLRSALLWRLYTSHFLSTWNMRSYEFAVILLFQKAYPDSLLPTSIRGVLTNGATLLLSPAIGTWVDRNAARFRTMQTTIFVQRASIVIGCVLWMIMFTVPSLAPPARSPSASSSHNSPTYVVGAITSRDILIGLLILLGTIERMCAVGNNLVMERDWVPTVASASEGVAADSHPPELHLHRLNAVMRRIDLVSKVLAPVAVSAVMLRTGSSGSTLALVVAVMNLLSVGIEVLAARRAWDACSVLRVKREGKRRLDEELLRDGEAGEDLLGQIRDEEGCEREIEGEKQTKGLKLFFSYDAWLASLSSALQSFSVLSLSGPMTTYLLTRHYSLGLITAARTATSVIEIASTVLFPLAASLLARFPSLLPANDPMAFLGVAGVTMQLALLIPCFAGLVSVSAPSDPHSSTNTTTATLDDPARMYPLATIAIFAFLGLSRLGHWTHNLAVQQIAQTRVPAARRVEFAGVETAFTSGAEIGRWAAAAVWSRPDQFAGVAAAGLGSVVVIWGLFGAWVWRVGRKDSATA